MANPTAPALIGTGELSVLVGRSLPSIERDIRARRIPEPMRLGTSRKWRLAEIVAWIEVGMPDAVTWQEWRSAHGFSPNAVPRREAAHV